LLKFLKKLKDGNFGLVARNITKIYLFLKSNYSESLPDQTTLIATAGIINAAKYIKTNTIEPAEIISMAKSSIDEGGDTDIKNEVYSLSAFIRQIEIEIFAIDTRMDYYEIRDIVMQKHTMIRENVEEAIADYKQQAKLTLWRRAAENFMVSEKTKHLRYLLKIEANISENAKQRTIQQ